MKPLQNLFKILALLLCFPSFAQESLVGRWQLIGRMCVDDGLFAPPSGYNIQEVWFQSNGAFEFLQTDVPNFEDEEYLEHKRESVYGRINETIAEHERTCDEGGEILERRESGDINLCDEPHKQDFYDRVRAGFAEEIAEIKEVEALVQGPLENRICYINSHGTYSISGSSVTISQQDPVATPGCGMQGPSSMTITGSYYFDSGNLYIVLPANASSREYCGASDEARIYARHNRQ